jgi:hypothetical protein
MSEVLVEHQMVEDQAARFATLIDQSLKNLGYPVGMGQGMSPEHLHALSIKIATKLYVGVILSGGNPDRLVRKVKS